MANDTVCSCNIANFLVGDQSDSLIKFNPLRAENKLNLPQPGVVSFPYVKIYIDDNRYITVGNKSQGKNPYAAIKSFKFGTMDGYKASFEIVDIQGGNFCLFVDKLIKDLNDPNIKDVSNIVRFRWGIRTVDCDGRLLDVRESCLLKTYVNTIDPHFDNGVFKFTLDCVDLSEIYLQQVADTEFGDVYLVEAINKLFKEKCKPPVSEVYYQLRGKDNRVIDGAGWPERPQMPFFKSDNGATEEIMGPRAKWSSKGRTPLSVLQDWFKNVLSINGKAFKFALQPASESCLGHAGLGAQWGTVLIIRESSIPGCLDNDDQINVDNKRIYIVNGGRASPVISFSPQIRYTFVQAAKAGGFQVMNNQKDIKQNDVNGCQDDASKEGNKLGAQATQEADNPAMEKNPQNPEKLIKIEKEQFAASNVFAPIVAELRIIGDPSYDSVLDIGTYVAIVFLNPFLPSKNNNKLDWTIQTIDGDNSNCNSILSHTKWMVLGFFHEITEGSYVTTLKLQLATPGVNISFKENLGNQ